MSLALSVVQSSGVAATFWVLNSVYLDAYAYSANVQMDGWVDATSKSNGYSPLTSVTISITFTPTHVLTGMSVMDAIYAKIQLDPFFSGATYTSDGI